MKEKRRAGNGRDTGFKLGPWLTAAAVVVVSGLITLFSVYVQPGSFLACFRGFLRQPLLILLNWFPALVSTAALYFLFGNVFYAGAVSGGVICTLSYVSLLKYAGREDTLVPADVLLIREALNAVRDYHLELFWDKLAAVAALVLCFVLLGVFIKSARPGKLLRLAGTGAAVLLFVLAVRFVYTSKPLYNSLEVPDRNNVGSVFSTLGFNYCFLYNYRLQPIDRPAQYSAAEVKRWIDSEPERPAASGLRPNVLIVMCEAFTDLAAEDAFAYGPEENPLRDYYRACDSDLALSGHLVVSNYGAGTANTEFDVMTGIPTNMVGEKVTSSFRIVRKQTDSLASVLSGDGYHTFFMHPGQSWFYNRNSVYAHLGITDQVFEEAFDASDYKGNWISDAAFLDVLEDCLQPRLTESDAPLFAYTVTIQNHQSYFQGKYGTPVEQAKVSVPLSDSSMEQVSVYMEGIRDSSAMLLELTEYLDGLSEPTLLVFFGDHRPNLADADSELGLPFRSAKNPQDIVDSYSVPFLIRANKAFGERKDVPAAYEALRLPPDHRISDHYLGGVILSLTGHAGEDPYFDYLNAMRLELPVLLPKSGVYVLSDGTPAASLDPERQALLDRLSKWIYYRLTS